MESNERGMDGSGGFVSAFIIRCIGTAILGASVTTAGWMYYKFEDASKERDQLRQRLSIIETSVDQFHNAFYRWQARHEKADEKLNDQLNDIRDYLRGKGWSDGK